MTRLIFEKMEYKVYRPVNYTFYSNCRFCYLSRYCWNILLCIYHIILDSGNKEWFLRFYLRRAFTLGCWTKVLLLNFIQLLQSIIRKSINFHYSSEYQLTHCLCLHLGYHYLLPLIGLHLKNIHKNNLFSCLRKQTKQ